MIQILFTKNLAWDYYNAHHKSYPPATQNVIPILKPWQIWFASLWHLHITQKAMSRSMRYLFTM